MGGLPSPARSAASGRHTGSLGRKPGVPADLPPVGMTPLPMTAPPPPIPSTYGAEPAWPYSAAAPPLLGRASPPIGAVPPVPRVPHGRTL